jgi:hypothetical protein
MSNSSNTPVLMMAPLQLALPSKRSVVETVVRQTHVQKNVDLAKGAASLAFRQTANLSVKKGGGEAGLAALKDELVSNIVTSHTLATCKVDRTNKKAADRRDAKKDAKSLL